MANVLADLCVESEAATLTALRLARAYDDGETRRSGGSRPRSPSTGSASARPPLVAEALECLGGNGYVEESRLPRLYRESPLNSIWEGSGNVHRARRAARARAASRRRSRRSSPSATRGRRDARLDAAVARLEHELADAGGGRRTRGSLELLALCAAGLPARPPRRAGGRRRVLRVAARPAGRRLRHASGIARPRSDRRTPPAAPLKDCRP